MKFNRLQRITRSFANHRRIEILNLLSQKNGISLGEISQLLKINLKTASEHTRKLTSGGLISKKYKGAVVNHNLTTRGRRVLKFLEKLEEA
jgi:Mn-dependent DtxR family transcriptional regulator